MAVSDAVGTLVGWMVLVAVGVLGSAVVGVGVIALLCCVAHPDRIKTIRIIRKLVSGFFISCSLKILP